MLLQNKKIFIITHPITVHGAEGKKVGRVAFFRFLTERGFFLLRTETPHRPAFTSEKWVRRLERVTVSPSARRSQHFGGQDGARGGGGRGEAIRGAALTLPDCRLSPSSSPHPDLFTPSHALHCTAHIVQHAARAKRRVICEELGRINKKGKKLCSRGVSIPGPYACEAYALPLSYGNAVVCEKRFFCGTRNARQEACPCRREKERGGGGNNLPLHPTSRLENVPSCPATPTPARH
jgi:hypothetical protein